MKRGWNLAMLCSSLDNWKSKRAFGGSILVLIRVFEVDGDFFCKMPPGRWKQVDHGFRSRKVHQFEELISPAYREIKRHLNPAYTCALSSVHQSWRDLKLIATRLGMRDAPDLTWALKLNTNPNTKAPLVLNFMDQCSPKALVLFRNASQNHITRDSTKKRPT